jgi:Immunity protein 26
MLKETYKRKTIRRKPGQIVRVQFDHRGYALALVLKEPLVAFYDRQFSSTEVDNYDISNLPIAFTIMVMNLAVTSGRWPVVGTVDVPSLFSSIPKFCKRDPISEALTIYHEIPELAPNYERPAKPGECVGLETAAVWDPEHVEDRLRDHFAGVPNKWVEQLKIL